LGWPGDRPPETLAAIKRAQQEAPGQPGETIIWDAGKGLKVGYERSVTFTARRVRD
jgi:hypothetical protein